MASTIGNILSLTRAGIVLAQHGVRFVPAGTKVPFALHLARAATLPIRALTWPFRIGQPKERRVAGALTSLGPSYIKLGQFLATRADLIGPELARDLGHLQDKLPPFSMWEARKAVEEALGGRLEDHFAAFGPPVAAASIAQVHKAVAIDAGTRRDVAVKILRPFLRPAMRDGFFHADMHQGNLLVDKTGQVVAVDFGIMGRLGAKERRFLAEILHGLITRDYRRTAVIHFEAGYVPPHHSVEVFAQAMRAIGEPIHGRTAAEISMADLLGQLFAYTEVFDMQTRPELLLLQKTMVVVEGVARSLDPDLNIWSAAEPIAKQWIEANYGVTGRLREAGEGAEVLGKVMAEVARLLEQAERTALALADMAQGGFKLDDDTVERLAAAQAHHGRWTRLALWVGALALAAMAVWLIMPVG